MKTKANQNHPVSETHMRLKEQFIAERMEEILDALEIDTATDPNTAGTARRWAKMMCREVLDGRFTECPEITTFPNDAQTDEIVLVGPIGVRSMCSHHLVPILGRCWIAILPGERLLGLSKFARLTRWVMARPQIQEEAAMQLADLLEEKLNPRGVAVVMKARHLCMSWRGVAEHESEMISSVMRGSFRKSDGARAELMSLIGDLR